MAYTRHGYHISGSNKGQGITKAIAPTGCGGPQKMCTECLEDVENYDSMIIGTPDDFTRQARRLVQVVVDEQYLKQASVHADLPDTYDTYVVWFTKTLQNWKAMVSTTLPDGMYYEVTYNGDAGEFYVDSYKKIDDRVVKPRKN